MLRSRAEKIREPARTLALEGQIELPKIYGWHYGRMMPTKADYDKYEPVFVSLVKPKYEMIDEYQHQVTALDLQITEAKEHLEEIKAEKKRLKKNKSKIPPELSAQHTSSSTFIHETTLEMERKKKACEKTEKAIPVWATRSTLLLPTDDPAVPEPQTLGLTSVTAG